MRKPINCRPLAAVILVVALAIFGMDIGHTAHASTTGNPIVTVGNTSANPVPTAAQGTTAITGNVGITGTPNVNVTNTPSVALAGTPTVDVASLPAVTLGGTPSVNIANGSISTTAPVATQFVTFNADVDPLKQGSIGFNSEMKIATLLVITQNDLQITLITTFTGQGGTSAGIVGAGPTDQLFLGTFPGDGQPHVINFGAPVRANSILVFNPALLTTATFNISVIGY